MGSLDCERSQAEKVVGLQNLFKRFSLNPLGKIGLFKAKAHFAPTFPNITRLRKDILENKKNDSYFFMADLTIH